MDRNENVIIISPPGVGKSMIAAGIGINACSAGKTVMFINAKELMDKLSEAVKKDILKQTLKALNKIQLLIIYELSSCSKNVLIISPAKHSDWGMPLYTCHIGYNGVV